MSVVTCSGHMSKSHNSSSSKAHPCMLPAKGLWLPFHERSGGPGAESLKGLSSAPAPLSKVPQPRSVDELPCGLCWQEKLQPLSHPGGTGAPSISVLGMNVRCPLAFKGQQDTSSGRAAPGRPWSSLEGPNRAPTFPLRRTGPFPEGCPTLTASPPPATLCELSSTRRDFSLAGTPVCRLLRSPRKPLIPMANGKC